MYKCEVTLTNNAHEQHAQLEVWEMKIRNGRSSTGVKKRSNVTGTYRGGEAQGQRLVRKPGCGRLAARAVDVIADLLPQCGTQAGALDGASVWNLGRRPPAPCDGAY